MLFLVEQADAAALPTLGGLDVSEVVVPPAAVKADLSLGLRFGADGRLSAALDYAVALFDRAGVQALAERYVRLLRAALTDPDTPLSRIDLLDPLEREALLRQSTGARYPLEPVSLHDLVHRQASRTPDAPAVAAGESTLSYRELDWRSARLAHLLAERGVRRGDVVGVCLHRGPDLVCGLLGVLMAGAAYLPLDPDDPPRRLDRLTRDASVRLVLTAADGPEVFEAAGIGTLRLGPLWTDGPAVTGPDLPVTVPADLAYVIYTSGSTGQPKGVMIDHAGITNRIAWMQRRYGLADGDRVLQKTPDTFDVSVWEFFWPLTVGAVLVVAPPGAHRDPVRLDGLIRSGQVTHLHFVPSMLDAFLDQVPRAPSSLRQVYCSGETLRTATAHRFAAWSTATLHNLYGPTEASIDVTSYEVDRIEPGAPTGSPGGSASARGVPIGTPISNMGVYLLDEQLNPVPPGVPGELYLAGVGPARGYLGRPDLTAERFVPDPFAEVPGGRLYRTGDLGRWLPDRTVEFLGRSDGQVKLHGVRVEPGEVESRLVEHPAVSSAAVTVYQPPSGPAQLIAYLPRPAARPTAADLRAHLAAQLPATMVPARFVTLAALPTTTSGKVDRAALPAPDTDRDAAERYVPPDTEVEQVFAAVWADVLGIDRVGTADDFFAVGGDSMRAIRVVGALRERGIALTVQDLFQHRTISAMARVAAAPRERIDDVTISPFGQISATDRMALPADVLDAYPPSQVQLGMLYEMMTDTRHRPYHNVTVYAIDDGGAFSAAALRTAAAQVVARHEVLRTSFDLTGHSEPLQLVHAGCPVRVVVEDLRGLDGGTQASVIRTGADEERAAPFDVSSPPLWRLHAYRTGQRTWCLAVIECHAILDGWSHNLLLGELLDRYRALRDGSEPMTVAPPVRRYDDYVAIERQVLEDDGSRAYWQQVLSSHETLRVPQEFGGATDGPAITVVEPVAEPGAVSALAAAAGVPVKSVFLAAFLKVMGALTPQPAFLCGLVSNGRPEIRGGTRCSACT